MTEMRTIATTNKLYNNVRRRLPK